MSESKVDVAQEAAKLMADLRGLLEAGGRFVLEQAPPLAKEIVAYGRAVETAAVIGGLLLIIVPFLVIYRKKWRKHSVDFLWDEGPIGMVLHACHLLPGGILFFASLPNFFKAWLAPRLYLLDYIGGLLK